MDTFIQNPDNPDDVRSVTLSDQLTVVDGLVATCPNPALVGWVVLAEWPPAPTPDELRAAMPTITARQFRLGLINAGITLQEVDDQIALIADPAEKAVAEIEWTYASTFERLHPLVVTVSLALNLTPEQVDSLWTWAADL